MSNSSKNGNEDNFPANSFARSRWAHVLALADQLRQNTELQKNEQLRKYAFDIPSTGPEQTLDPTHVDQMKSVENALLFAKTGNFNLDNLSEKFLDLKRTFNHMLELNNTDIQQVTLATSITKTALLMILRAIESIVEVSTRNTRKFPTLNSLISHIRSRQTELPIHGRLLVDWYNVAQILDLLLNDPDWLVQPRKARWALNVCDETLTWARGVFNENYRRNSLKRAIYDREDSIIISEVKDK